jgi:hypothetical protein
MTRSAPDTVLELAEGESRDDGASVRAMTAEVDSVERCEEGAGLFWRDRVACADRAVTCHRREHEIDRASERSPTGLRELAREVADDAPWLGAGEERGDGVHCDGAVANRSYLDSQASHFVGELFEDGHVCRRKLDDLGHEQSLHRYGPRCMCATKPIERHALGCCVLIEDEQRAIALA